MTVFEDERDLLAGPFGAKRKRPKSMTTTNTAASTPAAMSVSALSGEDIIRSASADGERMIFNGFEEDWQANILFRYTGKANVLGLNHPDSYFSNDRTGKYLRFATISYDSTAQPTDQTVVDEEFNVSLTNKENSQYLAESYSIHLKAHIVGKRVSKNKCKCIITPHMDYLSVPEVYVTEEVEGDQYRLGLWIRSEFARLIHVFKGVSKANNYTPLNVSYSTSGYYVNIPTNEDIVYGVDVIDESATIIEKQVCRGISIYDAVDKRFQKLEAIKYPDIKAATINTDMAWVPETEGESGAGYQRIPLSNADYGTSLSDTFIRIEAGTTKGFTVSEDGLYLLQIVSRFNTKSAIEDIDIELSLFKDDEQINASVMVMKLKADNGVLHTNPIGIGGAQVLVNLKSTNIVRLQMKFLNGAENGVINEGTTIQIMKIITIP